MSDSFRPHRLYVACQASLSFRSGENPASEGPEASELGRPGPGSVTDCGAARRDPEGVVLVTQSLVRGKAVRCHVILSCFGRFS